LQGSTDGSSLQLDEQLIGWTPTPLTRLATKTSSLDLYTSKDGRDHPTHRSFQSALLFAAVRTRDLQLCSLPDGLFQGLAHGLLTGFLNLLFHLGEACACR
jgi:hypothetical protein